MNSSPRLNRAFSFRLLMFERNPGPLCGVQAQLPDTCRTAEAGDAVELKSYGSAAVAGSLQNWFRALCDKSWADPAYMPQQQVLTFGFSCERGRGA